ncbi:MAG: xanthine dehydrogenase family protein subunit M [Bacteroidetes bacterium]|nr:xanthine dehydrogenase family protein subunit M [Bacteroidota bacterium]
MIPSSFAYHKPSTVDEAIQMLQDAGEDAKLLAGGHSLIPAMKLRMNSPSALIDLRGISGLRYIRQEGNAIAIGAASTHHDIIDSNLVQSHLAMMVQAGSQIGDIQVRNMGTIGGSIAHADPAADWPACLIAADASIEMKGPNGTRTVAAEDFFLGLYYTALEEGEIITEVKIPIPAPGTKSSYVKFHQPASRFAIVGCAVMMKSSGGTCQSIRVGFTGVSDMAFRDTDLEDAIRGKELSAANVEAASQVAAAGKDILGDHFASTDYRLHLARVFAARAIHAAS